MQKKIIRLTEDELRQLIKEATVNTLKEIDGKTYARIHNSTMQAQKNQARGNTQYQSEEKQYRCNNAGHSHRPRGCGFSDKAIQDIIFVPLSELKRDRSLDRIQIRATL